LGGAFATARDKFDSYSKHLTIIQSANVPTWSTSNYKPQGPSDSSGGFSDYSISQFYAVGTTLCPLPL